MRRKRSGIRSGLARGQDVPRAGRRVLVGRRRGFMLLDVLTGLAIVAVLITVLVGATFARARASRKLGDQLRATRVAEAVITQVQRGGDTKASTPDDAEVKVTPIDGDFGAVRWIKVDVKVGAVTASLVGPAAGGAR